MGTLAEYSPDIHEASNRRKGHNDKQDSFLLISVMFILTLLPAMSLLLRVLLFLMTCENPGRCSTEIKTSPTSINLGIFPPSSVTQGLVERKDRVPLRLSLHVHLNDGVHQWP